MAKLVGKRYAEALFEAGLGLNKLKDFMREMDTITEILKKETNLVNILSHPKISKSEKKELLSTIFTNSISQEMLNFLHIIIDKRREKFLFEISEEFEILYDEHYDIMKVTAITAVGMDEGLQNRLIDVLGNKANKTIVLKNIVDKDVIGGVFLRIENKIIDGTIKGQLQNIERVLKGATL